MVKLKAMKEYNLKHYAHIGDAVFELFVREIVINSVNTQKAIHQMTIKYVNANYQSELLNYLEEFLTEDEKELTRRGRNLPLTANKKNNQTTHRQATALEVLIGFLYLNDKKRLEELFEIINKKGL